MFVLSELNIERLIQTQIAYVVMRVIWLFNVRNVIKTNSRNQGTGI